MVTENSTQALLRPVYFCPLCGKSFKKPYNLKTHINIIHRGIKRYQCPVCAKKYSATINVRKHMQKEHSEQLSSIQASSDFLQTQDKDDLEVDITDKDSVAEEPVELLHSQTSTTQHNEGEGEDNSG